MNVFGQYSLGKERVEHIKNSVVKILIDGNSVGTGFFISEKGEILTCHHVVFNDNLIIENNQIKSRIQIVKNDSVTIDVFIPSYYRNKGFDLAKLYDYCLLQILDKKLIKDISYLNLGKFNDVNEGDFVVSCGYPHRIEVPFISSGLFSTKWIKNSYEIQEKDTITVPINVGWLDLTLNPGNSGGPIILLGNTYKEDKVVGIATFILNPFAQEAILLKKHALKSSKNIKINYNGINQIDINAVLSNAIANNSIGISGCISIDYFNETK
jgi:S1-C subfamily serine protease